MFWINFKRVTKSGFVNFFRNSWVSVATILIMVITLAIVGSLIFGKAVLVAVLDQIENKVDVTVYFKTDAEESDVVSLQDYLTKLDEVEKIEYVSREEALLAFKYRHAENSLIIQSLDELEDNPLGASLNIKAKNPSQYESIARFLEAGVFSSVDKINYRQNKLVIDRLANILEASRKLGTWLTIIFVFIAFLVTFNTIRFAVRSNKEEIKIMRLVGASNKYIRAPFIVEGLLYGLISALVTMFMFYPLTLWLGPLSERFFGGINIFHYYLANFFQMFIILLVIGIGLGIISSWVATRRYLKD
ncbi:cell division protein FtsX [Patescibacteria group bacterium]